jgi:hypothetical protein
MNKLIGSADFAGLVTATSDALGIPPADIEKDIWVVEVLRSVFRPVDGARIIFKGGTSLSKAYGATGRLRTGGTATYRFQGAGRLLRPHLPNQGDECFCW